MSEGQRHCAVVLDHFFGGRLPRGPAPVEFDDAHDVDHADDDRSRDNRRQVPRLEMHGGAITGRPPDKSTRSRPTPQFRRSSLRERAGSA